MELKLYDTLTREKRAFGPLDARRVRMYVCGPTVYDFAHIGNARPIIVFDVLFRLLRHLYGAEHVVYVRNVTDVDDKINARAAERGIPIRELTEETYRDFKDDVAALGCLEPSVEPRATEHIAEMKTLIERLLKSGHAYVAEQHVLFSVPSMPDYGRLSKRSPDELIAGARVEVAPYKKDPQDFVLWKPSKEGEPAWPSPAGIKTKGRPGWHIECSAMAWKHLGETFDIHGGGIDLVFPHHENEIAQTRCAFHSSVMANFWIHNGFLQVEGEKMAKSAGNFVTIRELLRGWNGRPWSGAVVRLAMLTTHYRQPIDWTLEKLSESRLEMALYAGACDVQNFTHRNGYERLWTDENQPTPDLLEALSDDLNTPDALAIVRERHKQLIKGNDQTRAEFIFNVRFLGLLRQETLEAHRLRAGVLGWGGIPVTLANKALGILPNLYTYSANNDAQMLETTATQLNKLGFIIEDKQKSGFLKVMYKGPPAQTIDDLIAVRLEARKAKDFKEADRIRDELAAMGVVLKDSKDGTTWEIAR